MLVKKKIINMLIIGSKVYNFILKKCINILKI
jgi:hypothetical protein